MHGHYFMNSGAIIESRFDFFAFDVSIIDAGDNCGVNNTLLQ